ncbi:MAG TPA: tetratricopeptide repeat protein [Paenalcaligenes sp.]|nr:tetratricopeptide repeat protein [Paenalcaligenes sp.]
MPMQERLLAMLEQGHDNLLLRFGLGKALVEDDQAAAAIEHLQKAVEFDETHASSWFWLGRAYLQDQNFAKAQEALSQARQYAEEKGEQQTVKMVDVFERRLKKAQDNSSA